MDEDSGQRCPKQVYHNGSGKAAEVKDGDSSAGGAVSKSKFPSGQTRKEVAKAV